MFKTCPKQGMVLLRAERLYLSLSFLRLRPGPPEKLKDLAIERRTSDAFVFLGPVPERCNSFIPGINVPYLVSYPWDEARLSLELSYYTVQEPAPDLHNIN